MNSAERHEARYQRRKAAREAKRREQLGKYDDFDRVSSPAYLLRANWDSRRGTDWKASVARYDMHAYRNSVLQSRTMRSGKALCKGFYNFTVIERGKRRDVHSCHYNERVIRRSLCVNALVPILSHNLVYDNGASLKGKGLQFAADRCEAHLHQFYRATGGNDGYVILIDFKGFFDNIQHEPLYEIIDTQIRDPRIRRLEKAYIAAHDADKPDAQKGKGLYIGPEDSQILAVAFPNRIDHLIKDVWRLPFSSRYMDDSYIFVKTKEEAHEIKRRLFAEYLKIGIIPNPKKTQIVKMSRGFTFLKTIYYLTDTGRVIRKPVHDSVVRERRKLKKFKRFHDQGEMTLDHASQSYMSFRGSLMKKDAHRSIQSLDKLFYSLFGVRPWQKSKKRRKQHERKVRTYQWRNLCPQILACGY